MRTKIFLAFLIVIITALLSQFLFEWLIVRDFENYVASVKEDQLFWITTSAENSYESGQWSQDTLSETIHWAMMMGLDIKILDTEGREVVSSALMMESLHPVMKKRMEGLFQIDKTKGNFQEYPLYSGGRIIGKLSARPFQKQEIAEKEMTFKRRSREFLLISLLIAGIGSLLIATYLSRYLSKPIANLKLAAEEVAEGNFGVRTAVRSHDEVGKLAQVFNKMAESLEKEEKLRKKLTSNIAHELRTPLTIMKTQIEALSDGIILEKEKALENLNSETDKIISLVKGIEDVTTAEASFFRKLEETNVDLREFLSGIAEAMRTLFTEKDLLLEVQGERNLAVTVDAEKLEIIVRNILINALKFTDKGGVSIRYGKEKDEIFIEIRDTGKGIAEENIPFLFNRFYRLGKEENRGLGLGLAIARELVTVMHGEITVKSKLGEGSCFTISLPVS
jgi:two-component system sensor histidine kinase BaeS